MQPDEDYFEALKNKKPRQPNKDGLHFMNSIKDYCYGPSKTSCKGKLFREQYAEDELVKQETYNELRCEVPGVPRSTFLMVFSPDGTKVASTHGNHNIYVTDLRSGKNIKKLVGHPRTPWCIAFHPTSNEIVASGCLGGQVRIWDLSGGSEVWTADTQSVIASIAFHPNERVLVIATLNEVYFWDWSRPDPFLRCNTGNPKEKVRYVAFDKLGHKLITGIANSPQTRWERVRAPVPVPRQVENSASPYRRRITPRLLNMQTQELSNSSEPSNREPLSSIPERERRITLCYRNLVREYEQLVQRYLQLYRPPTMIDRGTDPMEPGALSTTSGTQTARPSTSTQTAGVSSSPLVDGPSTSSTATAAASTSSAEADTQAPVDLSTTQPGPSSSAIASQPQSSPLPGSSQTINTESCVDTESSARSRGFERAPAQAETADSSRASAGTSTSSGSPLMTPSKIRSVMRKPASVFIKGTQTVDSRKHKASESPEMPKCEKRAKTNRSCSSSVGTPEPSQSENTADGTRSTWLSPTTETDTSVSSPVTETGTQTLNPARVLVIPQPGNPALNASAEAGHLDEPSTSTASLLATAPQDEPCPQLRIRCTSQSRSGTSTERDVGEGRSEQSTSQAPGSSTGVSESQTSNFLLHIDPPEGQSSTEQNNDDDEVLSLIRQSAEREVRSRILPIIRSVPAPDRLELIRLFENNRENVRMRFRSMCPPVFQKKSRRPVVDTTTSDSSSSEDEQSDTRPTAQLRPPAGLQINPSSTARHTLSRGAPRNITGSGPSSEGNSVRNFNTELEQLVTSLLTEIERSDGVASGVSAAMPANNTAHQAQEEQQQQPSGRNWFRRSTTYPTRTVIDRLLARRLESQATPNQNNVTTATSESTSTTQSTTTAGNAETRTSTTNMFTLPSTEPLYGRATISSHQSQDDSSTQAGPNRQIYVSPTYTVYRSTSIDIHPPYTSTTDSRPPPVSSSESERERPSAAPYRGNMSPIIPMSSRTRHFGDSTPYHSSSSSPESSSHSNNETTTTPAPTSLVGTTLRASVIHSRSSLSRFDSSGRRVSAFRPLRFRLPYVPLGRGSRLFSMFSSPRDQSFPLDEIVNYSELENSEDDPVPPPAAPASTSEAPQEAPPHTPTSPTHLEPTVNVDEDVPSSPSASFLRFHPFDPPPDLLSINPENIGIGNMYSNIVTDLESSLNDVRNLHATNRPGETSDMLSSFSERLENIMSQSDAILRNIRSTMDMLPGSSEASRQRNAEASPTYSDSSFYVRDQRNDNPSEPLDSLRFNPITADHTYPRNLDGPSTSNDVSPLMTTLQLTLSHIQHQARLLRQQVESIERIDRAMLEVAQLQLLRQLIVELVRHMQSISGESRSPGVSSVRQMMAGTRISDNSPYDSPSEDTSPQAGQSSSSQHNMPSTSHEASSSSHSHNHNFDRPSTSGNTSGQSSSASSTSQGRTRYSNHKTYPPSRLFRLQRQCRRTCVVHFLSKRQIRLDRSYRQSGLGRSSASRPLDLSNPLRAQPLSNYSLMTRRLEYLLTEQMRVFTRPQENTYSAPRFNATTDLGEHIIVLRLHSCLLRMHRVLNNSVTANALRNFRSDTAAVTHDGISRYSARHTLSLIIDDMSHDIEEISSANVSMQTRLQIHAVLAMSLLLSELLLLQIVDSIPPPPTGMNLDPERENLTTRIDRMCAEMLQSRFSGQSHQLTRSLRLMRLTVRHAYDALGRAYNSRRNAMLPGRQADTDRRELFGSIDRCLRTINSNNRRRFAAGGTAAGASATTTTATASATSGTSQQPQQQGQEGTSSDQTGAASTSDASSQQQQQTNATNDPHYREYLSTLCDVIARYSNNAVELNFGNGTGASSSGTQQATQGASSASNANNDSALEDSDNDDEDADFGTPPVTSASATRTSNLYRTSNINLVNNTQSESNTYRYNVPSVQVNDVPVTEPNTMSSPRYLSQRNRFAERVSELRSSPSLGLYRPRFLHPFYASGLNPFDADLDDPQREQIYDSDIVTNVTPNHRIQAWDISNGSAPVISCATKNLVVGECKIHNDASVDVSRDGTILVTLLPSGSYLNVTNRLGVYSLRWETLGQCLYTTNFYQNAVSVSLSPLSRHLVVGLASRRPAVTPNERWVMARIFRIERRRSSIGGATGGGLPVLRELEQNRDGRANSYRSLNCIRWLPVSGQGLIYATNTGQLIVLT